jgi:hypothetical protein
VGLNKKYKLLISEDFKLTFEQLPLVFSSDSSLRDARSVSFTDNFHHTNRRISIIVTPASRNDSQENITQTSLNNLQKNIAHEFNWNDDKQENENVVITDVDQTAYLNNNFFP